MKANQTVGYKIDTTKKVITFTVAGQGEFTLDMAKVSAENREYAAFVGMAQVRIVDGAAIGKADKDGRIIPEDVRCKMKADRMRALVEHYESGTTEWEMKRAARAPRVDSLEDIREAIGRATKRDAAGVERLVQASVRERGGDVEANLRYLAGAKAVQVALAEIRAERAPQRVDADEALASLMDSE